MRSVEEHLNAILDVVNPLPPYEQPLLEALGLPICTDVTVRHRPAELRQLRDGRVRRAGTTTSRRRAEDSPVQLPVVGESPPGRPRPTRSRPGQAVKIMTGAPMPAGADVVVPIEWTDGGRGQRPHHPGTASAGQHVRPRGDDITAGEHAARGGRHPRPAAGRDPRGDRPGSGSGRAAPARRGASRRAASCASRARQLGFDSIYDSNSFMLAAQAASGRRHRLPGRHRDRRPARADGDAIATSSSAPTSSSPAVG